MGLAVFAAGLAVWPAAGQAQDIAGRPVAVRPNPEYDPTGIGIGGFVLFPRLDLGMSYDDNIFASNRPIGDFVARIAPSLDLQSRWARDALGASVQVRSERYLNHPSEDVDAVKVAGNGRLDVGADGALELTGSFRRDADRRGDIESDRAGQGRAQFDETVGRLALTQEFNRLRLDVGLSVDKYSYASSLDQDLSRTDTVGSVRTSYVFSPRFNLFFQSSYDIQDYGLNGGARNSRIWTNVVGARFDIDTVFVGEVGAGVQRETFVAPGLATFVGPAVNGRVVWNIGKLTSLIANAEQAQESTRLANAFSRTRSFGSLEAQRQLGGDLIGIASYSFERDVYQNLNLRLDTHTVTLDARYPLNRYLAIDAAYVFRRRQSNNGVTTISQFNIGSYTENVVSVGLTGRF